eukprot:3232516-Prymnesium_polylepis.1
MLHDMWVPDLGLSLRVRPGMTARTEIRGSAPGIYPCPLALRGSRPTASAGCSVPRLVGIARHSTRGRAMRLAVLNPVRNMCFVTGCNA